MLNCIVVFLIVSKFGKCVWRLSLISLVNTTAIMVPIEPEMDDIPVTIRARQETEKGLHFTQY